MHIDGTLVSYTQIETINGTNGPLNKCFMIIQTLGKYPKKVAIQFMNDKINLLQAVRYTDVRVHLELSSTEKDGRWFSNINGWKVEQIPAVTVAPQQATTPQQQFGAWAAPTQAIPTTVAPQPQAWSPAPQPFSAPQTFAAPQQQMAAPQQQGNFFPPQIEQDVPF
jgi:hypothetical protein